MEDKKEILVGEDVCETVLDMIRSEGKKITDIANILGLTRQSVSQMIHRNKGMKFENLHKIAMALGYKVVLKKFENNS